MARITMYQMKDLGYKRTPTTAVLRVRFSNDEVWDVPAQVIVDSRDENYADEEEDTAGSIAIGGLSNYEIADWASNNMNWCDLAPYATKVIQPPKAFDYEGDWCNADKTVQPKETVK